MYSQHQLSDTTPPPLLHLMEIMWYFIVFICVSLAFVFKQVFWVSSVNLPIYTIADFSIGLFHVFIFRSSPYIFLTYLQSKFPSDYCKTASHCQIPHTLLYSYPTQCFHITHGNDHSVVFVNFFSFGFCISVSWCFLEIICFHLLIVSTRNIAQHRSDVSVYSFQ